MPAKSKQQQKFMGIVRAIQKGEEPAGKFSKAAQKAAKSMKKSSVRKYAKTKHDDLPKKVKEEKKRDYKAEYKKFQSSTKAKKYRAELNKYNRKKGTYGNGDGKDASHKGGKIVGFESQSKNRGRAEKSRLKKESNLVKLVDLIPEYSGFSGMSKFQRDRLDQRSKEKGKKPKKISKALKKKQDAWAKKYYTKGGGINIAKWKKDGSPGFPKESVNEDVDIIKRINRDIERFRKRKKDIMANKKDKMRVAKAKQVQNKIDGLKNKKKKERDRKRKSNESVNEAVSPKGWNMSKKYITFIAREVKNLAKYHRQQNEEDFLEVANYIELQIKQMKKNLNESMDAVKEIKDSDLISKLRSIVKDRQNKVIKDPKSGRKMRVDGYTANAIIKVYDALNNQNKKKFANVGLMKMQSIAFKFVK